MTDFAMEKPVPITVLAEAFGSDVELDGADGESGTYQVMAEFQVGDKQYAVLQNGKLRKDDEVLLFYIESDEQGELRLSTVEDDEEWENVLELYDEMTVSFD